MELQSSTCWWVYRHKLQHCFQKLIMRTQDFQKSSVSTGYGGTLFNPSTQANEASVQASLGCIIGSCLKTSQQHLLFYQQFQTQKVTYDQTQVLHLQMRLRRTAQHCPLTSFCTLAVLPNLFPGLLGATKLGSLLYLRLCFSYAIKYIFFLSLRVSWSVGSNTIIFQQDCLP